MNAWKIKTKYQMARLRKIQTDCTHDIINNNRYITCQKFRTILILDEEASKSETVRFFLHVRSNSKALSYLDGVSTR